MRNTRLAVAGVALICAMPVALAVPAAAETLGTMPNLVGMALGDAEGTVPFGTKINLVDGTGQGRKVVIPFNWKVCRQDPGPGAPLEHSTVVTLTVVKKVENCP